MDVSIRKLRSHTKEIIEAVNRGTSVTIKSHGKACAQIVPVKHKQKKIESDPAFGMWKDRSDSANVQQYVKKLREGRKL